MASLPESSTFDAGVYQLELTDPVIGGPSGVSNAPLKNLANRTKYLKDHVDALEASRAPLASPALTGTPTAPTAPTETNNTQLANTAFVKAALAALDLSGYAPKASPALTGTPTAPTPTAGDATTKLATTAFVVAEILNQFAGSGKVLLADVGYQKLPGGLIMQWGRGGLPGAINDFTVTFPVAFPNKLFQAFCIDAGALNGGSPVYGVNWWPAAAGTTGPFTSARFTCESVNLSEYTWFAIGY